MKPDSFGDHLAAIVGRDHVLTDADQLVAYGTDWTGRFRGEARLVVRPADSGQLARVVRACAEEGAAIVPQGGNTGLVGGSIPYNREVVLSTVRLNQLGEVDTLASTVRAGAGVTIEQLQQHARAAGLEYGVDLASRGSATVGGTIATNAGGVKVLRYGATRAQLLGVRAVLADGGIIDRMAGLYKDNSGYDLAQLLCGSEGTLAVVTDAVLRLVPQFEHRVVALLAFEDVEQALHTVAALRRSLPSLEAAEAFFEPGLQLVCDHTGLPRPFAGQHGMYVLLECAAGVDPTAEMLAALEAEQGYGDSAIAFDRPGRERLWRFREAHTESINAAGIPHKLDITIPHARLPQFVANVYDRIEAAAPGTRAILFGHVGDGNLHVNLLGPAPEDETADDAVITLVAELGGSISAEHGIGVAKKHWLHLVRSERDIAAMRAIRQALDPNGLFNPAVMLPG